MYFARERGKVLRWISLLVLGGCALVGSAREPVAVLAVSAEQRRLLDIVIVPVRAATALSIDGIPGLVSLPLDRSAAVTTPYAGRVARVLADEGDRIENGQPLAAVVSREYGDEQARLARIRAERDLAQRQAARDHILLADGIIPVARAEASAASLRSAQTEVQMLEASLREVSPAADNAAAFVLRAPFAGTVVSRQVATGDPLAALAVAFTVVADTGMRVELQVPMSLARRVRSGDSIEINEFPATVTGRGAMLDPATQTVKLRAQLAPTASLLPGQRVIATLKLPAAPADALEIPRAALVRNGEEAWVYVAAEKGFRRVPVEVLSQSAETAVVTGTLRDGDQVATRGVSSLKALDGE